MLIARFESSVWLVLAVLSVPANALASEPAPIDFSLDYAAAPGCPSPLDFEAALRARLPSARRVTQGVGVAQLRVQLPAANTGAVSQIQVSLPDGTSVQRELPEASCTEAVASMAVIAAMALEADARSHAAPAAPAAPESQSVSAAEAPAQLALPAPKLKSPSLAAVASSARSVATSTSPPRSTNAAGWRWSAIVSGGLESGVAPGLAPAALGGLDLASPAWGALGPRVRLSGLYAERTRARALDVAVSFRLFAARLDLCPNGLARGRWSGTACLEAELGQLRGAASGVEHPRDQSMTWFGLGLALQGAFALSPLFALQAATSVRALPRHDDFTIGPASVQQVPHFALDFNLGLSASWR
ncbi:MAG: hypothetical protein ABI548_13840 [Polyangiaceae bacterium]